MAPRDFLHSATAALSLGVFCATVMTSTVRAEPPQVVGPEATPSADLGAPAAPAAPPATPPGPPVSLTLRSGALVTGELVELVPADHVTVRVGSAPPMRFEMAEVATVALEASSSGAPAALAPPAPAESPARGQGAVDPRTAGLLVRRTELLLRPVGIGFPMTVTVVGSVLAAIGLISLPSALICRNEDRATCRDELSSSIITSTIGLTGAVLGGLWLRQRRQQRRDRADELRAIEQELGIGPSVARLRVLPHVDATRGELRLEARF